MSDSATAGHKRTEHSARAIPVVLVILALLHGLLYLAIVPPWQHYDEPTHFEYARLIALWDRKPGLNEVDLATNREIADSMYRFHFWPPGVRPDLLSTTPPNIGFNEKVHPPLYYAVAAVPIRWLRYSAIETQLYAARTLTVLLYALVVLCSWRITTILAPDRAALQITAPLILVLVPAFADQMSAVNNDSMVNFGITAMLLGCVLLIRDGPHPLSLALSIMGLAVAIATKRTALVGIAPFILALFWSFERRSMNWRVWAAALAVLSVALGYASFEYGPHGWSARPWLVDFDQQYLRLALDQAISTPSRWRAYPLLLDILFTSFWARFGWGAVAIGEWADWALRAVVVASVVGLILAGIRSDGASALWWRRIVWLFVITVLVGWLAAIIRFEAQEGFYVPRGRYIHLAIVPTVWLLIQGIERLAPRPWRMYSLLALIVLLALIDTAAWAGALSGYYYH